MFCYLHPNVKGVGTCMNCGRAVCQECATVVDGKIYCKDCAASGAFLPQQQKNNNGLALTSMILGILSIPLTFCYGAGFLLAIPAVIMGNVARKQIKNTGQEGSSQAKTGLITGWITIGLCIIAIVVFVLLMLGLFIGNVFTK